MTNFVMKSCSSDFIGLFYVENSIFSVFTDRVTYNYRPIKNFCIKLNLKKTVMYKISVRSTLQFENPLQKSHKASS